MSDSVATGDAGGGSPGVDTGVVGAAATPVTIDFPAVVLDVSWEEVVASSLNFGASFKKIKEKYSRHKADVEGHLPKFTNFILWSQLLIRLFSNTLADNRRCSHVFYAETAFFVVVMTWPCGLAAVFINNLVISVRNLTAKLIQLDEQLRLFIESSPLFLANNPIYVHDEADHLRAKMNRLKEKITIQGKEMSRLKTTYMAQILIMPLFSLILAAIIMASTWVQFCS